jgi:pectate lyase-like protein
MRFALLASLVLIAAPAFGADRPATYAEFYTGITPTADSDANGAVLKSEIASGIHPYIYLQRGTYTLDNPVVIDRSTPLFIHCADRFWTRFVAKTPGQPLFEIVDATLVNFAGCMFLPEGLASIPNTKAIVTHNSSSIQLELQDCTVVGSQLEFVGPGGYRIQNCDLNGQGLVSAPLTIDHPGADVLVFGGGGTNGANSLNSQVSEAYHIWQKRGRFRIYASTFAGGLGRADFRIESRSTLGPHVIANVRSEGVNGAINHGTTPSQLVYVPPTGDAVDVVIKSSEGSWLTGPPGDPRNCSLVEYNGAGTLWLIGNLIHFDCGLYLAQGVAPLGQIVSIGNVLGAPKPFEMSFSSRPVISAVDEFYYRVWANDPTLPGVRWTPDGVPPPKLNTYASVPLPPRDSLPPAIDRPRVTAALPGMLDVKSYGALGNGIADDTVAIQSALDDSCDGVTPKTIYFPAGTYKITATLYLSHHSSAACNGQNGNKMPPGGWIAGAGSDLTTLQMAPGLKLGAFATDGLATATVQGITFKTWAWQSGDDGNANLRIPNFDLEAYGDGGGPEPDFEASHGNSFYDVVFDGGWAGFGAGLTTPTLGNCSENAIFRGSFKNTRIGFDSGHSNAIANVVYDSSFANNWHSIGSLSSSGSASGGSWAAYRSISRGASVADFIGGAAGVRYFHGWDTDAPEYLVTADQPHFFGYLFENSHLAPVHTATNYPNVFRIGAAGGPIFLDSRLDSGVVSVGKGSSAQSYGVKLRSGIPGWVVSAATENPPNGQLEELHSYVIDDFEQGPFSSAAAPVGQPLSSSEQTGLFGGVAGGVRLVQVSAGGASSVSAVLAPVQVTDDGALVAWVGSGSAANFVYDGRPGGSTASGSSGELNLDLSLFDAIVIDASQLTSSQSPDQPVFTVWLSDATQTGAAGGSLQNGSNAVELSDFGNLDLTDIRQLRVELKNFSPQASARILAITAR